MSKSKLRSEAGIDCHALRLALQIIEGPSLEVSPMGLHLVFRRALQKLIGAGALTPLGPGGIVVCEECETGHLVGVDADPRHGRPSCFCPEAGRVPLDPVARQGYRLRPEWLLDWLANELRPSAQARPIAWLAGHLWEVGDVPIQQLRLRVYFACRIGTAAMLGQLGQKLERRSGKTGIVLTSSAGFEVPHRLHSGFSVVGIQEVLAEGEGMAAIDRVRLLAIAEPEASINPFRSGAPGRSSSKSVILAEFRDRVRNREILGELGDEARHLQGWLGLHHPDAPQPAWKTVKDIIRAEYRASQSRSSMCPK